MAALSRDYQFMEHFFNSYTWSKDGDRTLVLCGDDARFINSANGSGREANVEWGSKVEAMVASEILQVGEELLEDYMELYGTPT